MPKERIIGKEKERQNMQNFHVEMRKLSGIVGKHGFPFKLANYETHTHSTIYV